MVSLLTDLEPPNRLICHTAAADADVNAAAGGGVADEIVDVHIDELYYSILPP